MNIGRAKKIPMYFGWGIILTPLATFVGLLVPWLWLALFSPSLWPRMLSIAAPGTVILMPLLRSGYDLLDKEVDHDDFIGAGVILGFFVANFRNAVSCFEYIARDRSLDPYTFTPHHSFIHNLSGFLLLIALTGIPGAVGGGAAAGMFLRLTRPRSALNERK